VLDKAFSEVFDHINELVDSVNQPASEASSNTQGKKGDVRVVDAGQVQKLQIRTKHGWAYLTDSTGADITAKIS